MFDDQAISVNHGLPEAAYRLLATIEVLKTTFAGVVEEAAADILLEPAVLPHGDNRAARHRLMELGWVRTMTLPDQEQIQQEIQRPDVFTACITPGDGVPHAGTVEFTTAGAALWQQLQCEATGLAALDYSRIFQHCSLHSDTHGRILHLILDTNPAGANDDRISEWERQLIGLSGIEVIADGIAPHPWRNNWWQPPRPCNYRLTLRHVEKTGWAQSHGRPVCSLVTRSTVFRSSWDWTSTWQDCIEVRESTPASRPLCRDIP